MQKPTCEELSAAYAEMLGLKDEFLSAYADFSASGFRDKERKGAVLVVFERAAPKLEELKEMADELRIVEFEHFKMYRTEAEALKEIFTEVAESLGMSVHDVLTEKKRDVGERFGVDDLYVNGLILNYLPIKKLPASVKKLKNLKYLSLEVTDFADMDELEGLSSVENLWMSGCTYIKDLKIVEGLDSIKILDLRGSGIDQRASKNQTALLFWKKKLKKGQFYL